MNLLELLDEEKLKEDLLNILREAVENLIEGAQEDFENYLRDITAELVVAIRSGDKKMTDELKAQVKALGEINRLRAVNGQWQAVEQVFTVAMGVLGQIVGRMALVMV